MDIIPFGGEPFGSFPKVDVKETANEVIVVADIPGFDPQKVKLEVGQNAVKLSGTMSTEKESNDKNFYRKERSTHSFERVVPLPCSVKHDSVTAKAKNGILTIAIPKLNPMQPSTMKKIPIEEE